VDEYVARGLAVGVVVDRLAHAPQRVDLCATQIQRGGQALGYGAQVVAKRTDHGPGAKAPAERAVHEHAGADVGRRVEVRFEAGVLERRAARMVVEVAHAHAAREQALERGAVARHGDVAHQHFVARLGHHAFEQRDLAFEARDQCGLRRRMQAPLPHRAQAVGVAVADVEIPWRAQRGGC